MTDTTTVSLDINLGTHRDTERGTVSVRVTERGTGHPMLLLHGGAGLLSVEPFADLYAGERAACVLTPTHPGFNGTPRPHQLTTIRQLAALYVALLNRLDLTGVTVVGSSVGGWIAAEMALLASSRVAGYVLIDAVGIEVPGHPVVDFFSLTFPEIAQLSYHNPDAFGIDPDALPPAAQAAMAGNRESLKIYGGQSMTDPTLQARLAGVQTPVLVVWGDSDGIVGPDYGRALADAIPGAEFIVLADTGHLPQVESPRALLPVLGDFIERISVGSAPTSESAQ